MFNFKALFSIFLKNRNNRITTQQLYLLYLLFKQFNPTISFPQFYKHIYIYVFNFNLVSITYIFLGYFFFLKTFNLNKIYVSFVIKNYKSVFLSNYLDKPIIENF